VPWKKRAADLSPALVGLIGNVVNIVLTLTLARYLATLPPGTRIRPMVWTFQICVITTATLVVGLVLAAVNIVRGRSKPLALAGLALCLAPFFVAGALYLYYVGKYNLAMAD